jgi:predicted CoA-binding protein
MKKTIVIGASPKRSRYSNLVCHMLSDAGIGFVPVGITRGEIEGRKILNLRDKPAIDQVHTVTLYLSPKNQLEWYDYMLSLLPKRIIFNPGTENMEFAEMANAKGIETEFACNLVLLRTGQF